MSDTATAGYVLRGNGASFVSAQLGYTDLSGLPAIPSSFTWNVEGNATGNLSLSNAGYTSTFNQTSAVAWSWANTTVATVSTTNASPTFGLSAQYWATGAVSGTDTWTLGTSLAAGLNGISTLVIAHTGTTGAAQIQLPAPLSYGATDPQIIGVAGATCGISIGANAGFPLVVATQTGSIDVLRGYQGGTNQGSITSQSTSISFGLYNQLATGTAELGSAQSPSATYTVGKPLVSLGHGGSTWATTGIGPYIGINVGSQVSLGGSNSVHLNWAPTAGPGAFTAMQITPTVNNTSPGSAISSAIINSATSAAVTIASTSGYVVGQSVTISGVTTSGFTGLNGTWVVTATGTTTTVLGLVTTGLSAKGQATCNGNVLFGSWSPTFGSYTALLINPTETAVIAAVTNKLLDLQVSGVSVFAVTNKGHVQAGTPGGTALTDNAGTVTITAGNTTQAYVFTSSYTGTSAPIVVITPTSDPLVAGVAQGYWITYSGSAGAWTGFTVHIQAALAGNVIFNYIVVGTA